MHTKTLQTYFLIALIILACVLTFFVFKPFLIVLVFAAIFAVVLQPLYRWMLAYMKQMPGLAALATMLVAVVCILVPLTFISIQIVDEAQRLYSAVSDGAAETYIHTAFEYVRDLAATYVPGFEFTATDPSLSIDQYMKDGLSWLILHLGGAFGGAARLLLALFVFLIALYYLLRDGDRLKKTIIAVSPLADSDDSIVLERLALAVHSVIRGNLTIALIQGVLTGIGFTLFGVPNSILWGVVAALAALIPGVGTALVLAPATVYLFVTGATTAGIGLMVWGILAVGLIDNLLGPRLVGKGMQLHPLLVLLSVFGGLAYFGPAGLFLGPLSVSFLFALVSIYPHINKRAA